MATAVIMPRQGQSVESCVIGMWHKRKGDKVSIGDILFTYETDKATFEEESKAEGVVLEIFYEEGDDVECLKTVCVIGNEGENIDEFKPGGGDSSELYPNAEKPEKETPADYAPTSVGEGLNTQENSEFRIPNSEFNPVSPRARALAEKTGADVSRAVPTGANGRIMERDILKVIADGHLATRAVEERFTQITGTGIGGRVTTSDIAAFPTTAHPKIQPSSDSEFRIPSTKLKPAIPDSEEIKLTNIRKVIAKTMNASLSNAAQLTQHSSFDATDILNFRKKLKSVQEREELSGISVTDIIIYATARVLLKHKSINAHFLGDKMTLFNNSHIGVAVDTPRGLLVPTIMNASSLTLTEISANAKALIEKCKQGTIEPDSLRGASFTISNLGGLGIEMFTPVLNPPQTGLLGVCSIIERTKEGKPYPAMGLSVTYDHQALDGADAARFAKDLTQYLENFTFNIALEGKL